MLMSPLAKPDHENPHIAQRFELFAAGLEVSYLVDYLNMKLNKEMLYYNYKL